jgi:hypothetical protein
MYKNGKKLIVVMLTMVFVLLGSFGNTMAKQEGSEINLADEAEFKEVMKEFKKYVKKDKDGHVFFDEEKALKAEADNIIFQIGKEFNQISKAYGTDGQNTDITIEWGIPVHGNWCGPGHGGGTPIDGLDSACKIHDQCYEKNGYFDCDCDDQLLTNILVVLPTLSWTVQIKAVAIYAYFDNTFCF